MAVVALQPSRLAVVVAVDDSLCIHSECVKRSVALWSYPQLYRKRRYCQLSSNFIVSAKKEQLGSLHKQCATACK